ncbi:caspase-1-B-like [Spodoptera litura]|uniref:Caspase-1-B-like n=1 Tax=Spodoptera litura TaxID=69820 RepID=A0A9J7DUE2_SPOLT|nr:caspase-1-B-like [Spodoptera litura]
MENETEYYQSYPGIYFMSRKGKGKKKKKGKSGKKTKDNNGDNKSESETLESVEDPIMTDENGSGPDETEDDSNKSVIYRANVDESVDLNENRISTDAMMSVPPEYETAPEKVKFINNEDVEILESNVDKLKFEEESIFENEEKKYTRINTRALPKEATTYELETFNKHAMIIFNQKEIDGHLPRLGTEKDVEALTRTFSNYGFEVTPHNNLTKDELFKELKTFSERDFTDYGCVAVAILTHGSNNGLLRAKDQQYSEIEVINHFKDSSKPTLVTKPKIIIIQACRGTKITQGLPVFHAGKIRKDFDEEDLEPYILPVESDLLILHSSYVGRASHRNELYGSWFIQTLCKKIDGLSPTQDLESIITEVKREVAIDKQHEEYNKRTFEMNVNKQMPVLTSTLIRKLFLKKFGEKGRKETYVDQSRRPSESQHEVLDAVNAVAVPVTPLLVQFGPCSCFLDHFVYMRDCLRYFVEENPCDETAQNFLDIANTFEDGVEFNTPKDKMCKAISKHLMNNARSSKYYKFLYFYHSQQNSQVQTTPPQPYQ